MLGVTKQTYNKLGILTEIFEKNNHLNTFRISKIVSTRSIFNQSELIFTCHDTRLLEARKVTMISRKIIYI